MPTSKRHIDQAVANASVARRLIKTTNMPLHLDWAMVALFYSALHYVDAVLCPTHPKRHGDRDNQIVFEGKTQGVWEHYRVLKNRSRRVRYDCEPMRDEQELADLWNEDYEPLVNHLKAQLPP